jgi:hypothetical protein
MTIEMRGGGVEADIFFGPNVGKGRRGSGPENKNEKYAGTLL